MKQLTISKLIGLIKLITGQKYFGQQGKEGQEETSTHPLLTVPHHLLPSPHLTSPPAAVLGRTGNAHPFGVGI